MTTCGQSQWPVQSIRSTVTSWPVSKKCVCVSVWIKGSMADSAAVQCHTGSPSGMFLSPGMGCGASLAEPPLPVPCQPALGTAHLRCTLGERQLPVNHFRLWVSFCLSVWHLVGSVSSKMASSLASSSEHLYLVVWLFWDWLVCMWACLRPCLTAFASRCICFLCFFPPVSETKMFSSGNSAGLLYLHTVSTLWVIQSLFHH